jgi:flagellar basal body P-ring formation protein FlgA
MRNVLNALACATLVTMVAAIHSPPARAQQDAAPVRHAVDQFLRAETAGLPGQVTISVGTVDSRNQLPPCERLEPFLPAGVRAWGRINVGVRCLHPASWSIYLPAQVSVLGEYLVIAQALRPGQIVGPADLRREKGDLAEQPASVLTDPTQAQGHAARYALAAGQPLRAEMLRLPPAVQQGQKVRVIFGGRGFEVSNEGVALNTVGEGQVAQVRLPGGQVLSGVARPGGVVEIRP